MASNEVLHSHDFSASVVKDQISHHRETSIDTSLKISWHPFRNETLVEKYNSISKWGSYRPGFYFGMKTSTPEDGGSMSSGIIWADATRTQFRHDTKQGELSKFEWSRHDGRHFGKQVLSDSSIGIDLTTSFVAHHPETNIVWIQKIGIQATRTISRTNDDTLPLYFYFGSDCADGGIRLACLSKTQITNIEFFEFSGVDDFSGIQLIGRNHDSNWLVLSVATKGAESTSYVAVPSVDIDNGSAKLIKEASSSRRGRHSRHNKKGSDFNLFDEFGDLRNEIRVLNDSVVANFVAFQITYKQDLEAYFVLQEISTEYSLEQAQHIALESLNSSPLQQQFDQLEANYLVDFERRFLTNSRGFSPKDDKVLGLSDDEIESVKVALSSLLGGLGYFEGVPSIEFSIKSELDLRNFGELQNNSNLNSNIGRVKLFTGSPSRTAFPRGFLWDEGFHQMVISHWDLDITFRVICDWLNAMYLSPIPDESASLMGWIPREMILGDDGARRVPGEFITQRATIANPPTFLLVLESLLNRLRDECDKSQQLCPLVVHHENTKIVQFVSDIYPRLHYWIQWFRYSQQGELFGTFRWRGRSLGDNKVVPNTLASGLDDYPRGLIPSFEERHLDLLCWMIKAYESMSRIEDAVSEYKTSLTQEARNIIDHSNYHEQLEYLKSNLDQHHWSDKYRGYFDFGLVNESAVFVQEVMFRCAAKDLKDQPSAVDIYVPISLLQSGGSFCPQSHPKPLYPLGDGNGGYLTREKVGADGFYMEFIPRVGYVSIFPFILRAVAPSSPKLATLLDIMEDPSLLYTPYGLRSLATSDLFYLRRNAPGDAPYWR